MSRSILGMPTFREPCNPLHHRSRLDTELFLRFFLLLFVGVVGEERRELWEGKRWGKLVSLL